MSTQRFTPILRVLCVVLALALTAVACGSSSDDSAEDSTEDTSSAEAEATAEAVAAAEAAAAAAEDEPEEVGAGTEDEPEPAEPISGTALCELGTTLDAIYIAVAAAMCDIEISDDDLGNIIIEPCANPDLTPRIRYQEGETFELLYWSHMMVRFHPTDEYEGSQTLGNAPPTIGIPADLEDRTVVVALDAGTHGEFVSAVVAKILDVPPVMVPLDDPNQPFDAGPTVPLPGAVPVQEITGAQLPSLSSAAPIAKEADIARALELYDSTIDGQLPTDTIFVINMSFGAHNCEQPPVALENVLTNLAKKGVRFTASAGNGETTERIWPAAFATTAVDPVLSDQMWSVGSLAADGTRSCFSNYGADNDSDGFDDSVELWLPGEEVLPVVMAGTWSGTSFAAPQAAALIAAGQDLDQFKVMPAPPVSMHGVVFVDENGNPREDKDGIEVTAQTFCSDGSGYEPKGVEYN